MSENNNHIDNLFKEKLGERSFEVPGAFLADLENKLDAAPIASKQFPAVWFWMSSILAAGIAVAGYLLMSSPTPVPNIYSAVKTNGFINTTQSPSAEALFVKVKNADEEDTFIAASAYKKVPQAFEDDNQKKLTAMKKEVQKNYQRIEDSIQRINEMNLANSVDNSNGNAVGKSNFNSLSNFGNGLNSNDYNLDSDEEKLLASLGANDFVRKLLTQDPDFGALNGQRQQFLTQATNLTFVDDTLKRIRYVIRDSVVIRDSLIIRDSINYIDSVITSTDKGVDLKNAQNGRRFELQAFGGFLNAKPIIESSFAPDTSGLTAGDSRLLSPNFGFNLYWYYKNFNIGAGAEYYHYGEKYDYSTLTTNSIFDQLDSTFVSQIVDSNGQFWDPATSALPPFDTIQILSSLDSTFVNDSTITNNSGQNTYSRFVIPLNFGYQFNYKNWAFTPRVGLNLEFTTAYRPGYYSSALNEEILEIDQRKFGISYRLQFEIRRNFDKFHIFVNPYYQNNVGFTIETPDLKRKYGGLGAQFGFGVRF